MLTHWCRRADRTPSHVGVLGTGSYLPAQVMTNDDVGAAAGVTDEWIERKTGIRHRRWAKLDEATSDLAVIAGQAALERAGISARQLSLVVVATSTPDSPQPPTACVVADEIGAAAGTAAFDVNAVCSGFVVGLTAAEGMLRDADAAYALVVGADVYSRILDPADRRTVVLFGDGAGAVVLGRSTRGRLLASRLASFGAERGLVRVAAGGSRLPASQETLHAGLHYFAMDGRAVRDFVSGTVGPAIRAFVAEAGFRPDEIDHFVPHQANGRLLAELADAVEIAPGRTWTSVTEFGNTGSAAVPVTLDQAARSGAVEPGDLVLLAGFGGGMTMALALLRW